MPQVRKYDDDFRMRAFDLYCEGKSPKQIAKVLGVTNFVIQRLKNAKWPMSWEKGRSERTAKKIELIEEKALESLLSIRRRNQQKYKQSMDITLMHMAKKAQAGTLDDKVAADVFFRSGQEQEKTHLPLEQAHAPKAPGISAGVIATPDKGAAAVISVMEAAFEKAYGTGSTEENPGSD